MCNLHKVIYLCAGTDYRIAELCPVNTTVSADFHKIFDNHTAVMRYKPVTAVYKSITIAR